MGVEHPDLFVLSLHESLPHMPLLISDMKLDKYKDAVKETALYSHTIAHGMTEQDVVMLGLPMMTNLNTQCLAVILMLLMSILISVSCISIIANDICIIQHEYYSNKAIDICIVYGYGFFLYEYFTRSGAQLS